MEKTPVVCGVAAIENAYDETFHIEILPRENLIAREKELVKIAKTKMPDLNANDIEAAKRIIAGTARSMGVEVEK